MQITQLLEQINNFLKPPKTKAIDVPPYLILNSKERPGLSPLKTTQSILEKKKELGLPVGTYEDGTPNYDDIMIRQMVTEVFKSLLEDAKITVVIPPGTQLTASGANAGGPVVSQGVTVTITIGGAVIQ